MIRKNIIWCILLIVTGVVVLFVTSLSGTPTAAASGQIKFVVGQKTYTVDGQARNMDAATFVKDGRVYVPLRYLGNALGASVDWDSTTRKITLIKGQVKVELVVGSNTITVNGSSRQMDAVPLARNGRTYLPARYVAEALGYEVKWDAASQTVTVQPAAGAPRIGLGFGESYHTIHVTSAGLSCPACHKTTMTTQLEIFSGQDVSPAAPGPVDRRVCLGCHTSGLARDIYQ